MITNVISARTAQNATDRADDPVTVCLRRGLWVNFQGRQAGYAGNGGDGIADADAEHLAHIGGWIGADQEHALSGFGQLDGRGTGNRGLADTAFAGEEEEARRPI